MQNVDEILNAIKERNLNVSEISRNTGIPGTRIYKWLDNKGKPKGEDSKTLQDWAKKYLEKLPNSNSSDTQKEPTAMQILAVLTNTINLQTEAYREHAAALKVQAELMESIKKDMARQESQARIEANLNRVFGGLETIGEIQEHAIKKILSDLAEIKANRNGPSTG